MTVRQYLMPRSVPEAVELLVRHRPDLLVMAGGTVAMPLVNDGVSLPELVMSLRRAGLDRLERHGDSLAIGAATTLSQLANQTDIPLLAEAARNTASWPIRNMATVGGNLFTPPPGGDVAVALLCLDARVRLAGPTRERELPLVEFFTGFMSTALADNELLTEIIVPTHWHDSTFIKFGRKHANTPAVVTVAIALELHGADVHDARIALGAVGPHPIRAAAAEKLLIGAQLTSDVIDTVADAAASESQPFTDAIATEWYRRRMVAVFVRRALSRFSA